MRYRFNHPDADSPRRSVHSHVMLRLLEVRALPREGMPARMLPGRDSTGAHTEIRVWVAPHVPKFRKAWNGAEYVEKLVKTSVHRVRCECPGCGAELSAGRLFQHLCRGRVSSAELADEELLRTRNVQRHPPSYSCDCAECRSARASPSNPHGYVYRREEP